LDGEGIARVVARIADEVPTMGPALQDLTDHLRYSELLRMLRAAHAATDGGKGVV
jgi:hypothetical protein